MITTVARLALALLVIAAFPVAAGTTPQTITFDPLPDRGVDQSPFSVSATASSGLPVTFFSNTTPVCTVSGASVNLLQSGTCTIVASQAGDATYAPAPNVARSFQVSRVTTTTSLSVSPASSLHTEPVKLTVTVSSSSAPSGTVRVLAGSTEVASGALGPAGTVQLVSSTIPIGSWGLTAAYDGNGFYAPSTSAPVSHDVSCNPYLEGRRDASFGCEGLVDLPGPNGGALALQPDGRILVLRDNRVVRFMPDGSVDLSFNGGGYEIPPPPPGTTQGWGLLAVSPSGRTFVLGNSSDGSSAVLALTAGGQPDATFGAGGRANLAMSAYAIASLADGGVLVAGTDGAPRLLRLSASGASDSAFAAASSTALAAAGTPFRLRVMADGRIVVLTTTSLVMLLANGQFDASFAGTGSVTLDFNPTALGLAPDGRILVAGNRDSARYFLARRFFANGQPDATLIIEDYDDRPPFAVRTSKVPCSIEQDMAGQIHICHSESGGTPSFAVNIVSYLRYDAAGVLRETRSSSGPLVLQPDGKVLILWSRFSQATSSNPIYLERLHAAGRVQPFGRNDNAFPNRDVTSRPLTVFVGGPVTVSGGSYSIGCREPYTTAPGTVVVGDTICVRQRTGTSGQLVRTVLNVDGQGFALTTIGAADNAAAMVSHYYRAILGRLADAEGQRYWEGEAARAVGLGVDRNEAWYAMSAAFFSSGEYRSPPRPDDTFVRDLYDTYFGRPPDDEGLTYWKGQLGSGLPREVALATFMFSAEFTGFTQSLFGTTATRAEVDAVMDFYRGLLARIPDSDGLAAWVGRFRTAQCAGSSAVAAEANNISAAFIGSAEYAGRARTNSQFVGDLYNAMLRRGGDLDGVLYWIGQLDSGARTREQVRAAFAGTPEFSGRIAAIVNEGCQP